MTCIAGLAEGGVVWVGADSCGTTNSNWYVLEANAKVFRKGDALFGVTGSPRIGQLIQYSMNMPVFHGNDVDVETFEITQAIRKCLRDGGCNETNDGVDGFGGTIPMGYRGKLFIINSDYGVVEPMEKYYAVGSGGPAALGSLYTTVGEDPLFRLETALLAAVETNPYVRRPLTILHT